MGGQAGARAGIAQMLIGCCCFTGMATCAKLAHLADPGLSTFVTSAVRSWVNIAALLWMARGSVRLLVGDGRAALWARGVAGATALMTYFAAFTRIGVGESSFLNQTSAIWVAALAPPVLGEPTRPGIWGAVLASMAGIALLSHPRGELTSPDTVGRLLGAASGLAAALAYLSVRRAGQSNPAITIVFYFTALAAVSATGLALASGAGWPQGGATWAALLGAGVMATLGQIFLTRAYQLAPAAPVAAAGSAAPLLQSLAGWLIFGEVPDAAGVAGMAILLAATASLPWLQAERPAAR